MELISPRTKQDPARYYFISYMVTRDSRGDARGNGPNHRRHESSIFLRMGRNDCQHAATASFLLEIRDIWPESIAAVGAMKKRLPLRILERWKKLCIARTHIVTVGDGYRSNYLAAALIRREFPS